MFYVEGWVPLVDVIDRVSRALATRLRAEMQGDKVGSASYYDELYAETWRVCDTCPAGIIGPGGTVIGLSSRLFTRNNEASQFGDYLCLTIGQLGSGYWRPWFEDADPHARPAEYIDLTAFVQPFLNAHVVIRDDEVLAKLLADMSVTKAEIPTKRGAGRPKVQLDFVPIYLRIYPNGHAGLTRMEVIDRVHEEGGPRISERTFDRVIRKLKSPE